MIAVIGPTASGKSELAIKIAKDFNGEIVSADSRQFYKGMDIGTGKVTSDEMENIPHHLIDILDPSEKFNLFDFQQLAFKTIDNIIDRGKLPILVGGTGLFISSVIENYALSQAGVDEELRRELNKLDDGELRKKLLEIDPHANIDLKNKRRIIRQLEYFLNDPDYVPGKRETKYATLIIEPKYNRDELYSKINKRVQNMFNEGLLEEVQNLVDEYGFDANAMSAIGYREFQGAYDFKNLPEHKLEKIKEEIKRNTRRYAKRQITWFKKYNSQ